MSIDLANDLWIELKEYINRAEREDAASAMVELLSDYDHSAEEIVAAFKSDFDVREVLQKEYPEFDLDDEPDDDYFYEDDE